MYKKLLGGLLCCLMAFTACDNDNKNEFHRLNFFPALSSGKIWFADQSTDSIVLQTTDSWKLAVETLNGNDKWLTATPESGTVPPTTSPRSASPSPSLPTPPAKFAQRASTSRSRPTRFAASASPPHKPRGSMSFAPNPCSRAPSCKAKSRSPNTTAATPCPFLSRCSTPRPAPPSAPSASMTPTPRSTPSPPTPTGSSCPPNRQNPAPRPQREDHLSRKPRSHTPHRPLGAHLRRRHHLHHLQPKCSLEIIPHSFGTSEAQRAATIDCPTPMVGRISLFRE